jgi:Zn-dependent protease
MLGSLFTNPVLFLIWAVSLVTAITIHECAHAFAADKLGDPTPRISGRLTLNPLAHLDPIGTVALLLIGFGWGKPVGFDPYNLRNPRRDAAIISLAGPVSNLLLASVLAVVLHFLSANSLISTLLIFLIQLNVMLAIFNLVPVAPLDGQKIVTGILPADLARDFDAIMRQWGTVILIFLILPMGGTSAISALISPVISTITSFLIHF